MLRGYPSIDRGSLELVTPPATEPVTRDETKLHCRIDITADDTYIDSLIIAAREFVELQTRRALITQTWRLVLDNWPGGRELWWDGVREGPISMVDASAEVEIRKGGFIAITSVVTVNEDATTTTWDSSNYYAVTRNSMGRLVKVSGTTWPIMALPVRQVGGIVITFTAGYGTLAASVPVSLRQAIKDIVLHWYEVREAVGETSRWHPPMKTAAILQQFTVGR